MDHSERVTAQARGAPLAELSFLPCSEVQALVALAARRRGGVLIAGEPGSGREAVARAIHARSSRAEAPFIVIDCTADPHRSLSRLLDDHGQAAFGRRTGRARSEIAGVNLRVTAGRCFCVTPSTFPSRCKVD